MNDQFDEPTKGRTQSAARALLCLAVAAQLAGLARAEDIYVAATASSNGDGSATSPYRHITDAVQRARADRQSGLGERINIHVAPGTYTGSYKAARVQREPALEALPIVLNVPNLTLSGATRLDIDASGLPMGARPSTETVITTDESVQSPEATASLVLIGPTTDGGRGDGVAVTGLILDAAAVSGLQSVWLDRAADFDIRGNVVMRAGDGLRSRMSSGTVKGNLFVGNGFAGAYLSGGNSTYPANVRVIGNRGFSNARGGAVLGAWGNTIALDLGANSLQSPPLVLSDDPSSWPNVFTATVNENDFSDNVVFGLRCVAYPPDYYYKLKGALTTSLRVNVSDNLFNRNRNYGLVLDAAFPPPYSDKSAVSARFDLTLHNNHLTGNGRAPAMFTFERLFVSLGTDSPMFFKYLSQSLYNVNDPEGETLGFDYDNPVADPYEGTVLNNTLMVNGAVVATGTRITPLNP